MRETGAWQASHRYVRTPFVRVTLSPSNAIRSERAIERNTMRQQQVMANQPQREMEEASSATRRTVRSAQHVGRNHAAHAPERETSEQRRQKSVVSEGERHASQQMATK
jgi:hypothetical protein